MIRDLLTPEAQSDRYVWMAVACAHAGIGAALWPVTGMVLGLLTYAAFERLQGYVAGRMLWWDSVADWCAVAFGMLVARAIWEHDMQAYSAAVIGCGLMTLIGGAVRR